MQKTFRDYHLFKALESYDFEALPIDVHLSQYFRKNRAIGSKDRKVIAEKIYKMIRWLGLIDYFCEKSHDWEERYASWKKINLNVHIADPQVPIHVRASFPKNFFQRLVAYFGEEKAFAFCLACNTPAPTTVRINILKTTREALYSKWKETFSVSLTETSIWGINFENKLNFHTLEDFKQGFFEVQDEASQLIADLVEVKPGNWVLDYCAGAGGKSLAFAHKLQKQGQIFLHDIRPRPLVEAKKRLKRAGIENAQILSYDSSQKEQLKGKMDWILVDVPCTGSGTLRRNPDLKWKFSEEKLYRLVQEQREIFQQALSYLHPNGKIVYATCSVLPEENEEQLLYFQKQFSLDLVGEPFRSLPSEGSMDGFFGCVFKMS